MLTIQELGTEILSGNLKKFYILGGTEYGLKEKYLDIIADKYEGKRTEVGNIQEVISMFRTKQLFPKPPQLYIVRYDSAFVKTLNNQKTIDTIKHLKIRGCLVMLYEDEKEVKKLDSAFPKNTGRLDTPSVELITKYLKIDYPKLTKRLIDIAINVGHNYGHAKRICGMMNDGPVSILKDMTDFELQQLFGHEEIIDNDTIQEAIVNRNFPVLCKILDDYTDNECQMMYYSIFTAMLKLEKAVSSRQTGGVYGKGKKYWPIPDIYYMFANTYESLQRSRRMSCNLKEELIYLFGLIRFSPIPSPEVMKR